MRLEFLRPLPKNCSESSIRAQEQVWFDRRQGTTGGQLPRRIVVEVPRLVFHFYVQEGRVRTRAKIQPHFARRNG